MKNRFLGLAAALGLLAAPSAFSQEFSALVSPPRIEAAAKAGGVYRDVVEITNMSAAPARYHLQTMDWELDNQAQAVFSEPLKAGSCRPWVAIEAKQIQVAPGGKYRYRFEVAVPADAPSGECRFAIMVAGEPQDVAGGRVPQVAGRLGIIVYLAINGAGPQFEIVGSQRTRVENVERPALKVRNTGTAHGRLEGFVDGVDARGQKIVFTPSNLPILAGETRVVPLAPVPEKGKPDPTIVYPLTLRGKIDWEQARLNIDGTVVP